MANEPDITPILEELASGRIDASQAARRIDELKKIQSGSRAADPADESTHAAPRRAEPSDEELRQAGDYESGRRQYPPYSRDVFGQPDAEADPEPVEDEVPRSRRRPGGAKGVDRVSVRSVGRRVRIVGDPSVATASAQGPHVLRRSGSVLEVHSDGEVGPSLDGFSLLRPPRSLDDLRAMGLGKELYLRINPNLIVDVEVTAGSLTTENVPYLGKVRVTAGGATMDNVAEVSDALIQAGSATIKGTITSGRSRVRSESGQLTIEFGRGSNVVVRGEAQLGKITWSNAPTGHVDEIVLGNGSARFDVGVVMGWANIKADEEDQQ